MLVYHRILGFKDNFSFLFNVGSLKYLESMWVFLVKHFKDYMLMGCWGDVLCLSKLTNLTESITPFLNLSITAKFVYIISQSNYCMWKRCPQILWNLLIYTVLSLFKDSWKIRALLKWVLTFLSHSSLHSMLFPVLSIKAHLLTLESILLLDTHGTELGSVFHLDPHSCALDGTPPLPSRLEHVTSGSREPIPVPWSEGLIQGHGGERLPMTWKQGPRDAVAMSPPCESWKRS